MTEVRTENPHPRVRRQFFCLDCNVDTCSNGGIGEYYSVKDEIWLKANPRDYYGDMLCIGCLEKRLGRELTSDDFQDLPINKISWGPKSVRLMRRLGL